MSIIERAWRLHQRGGTRPVVSTRSPLNVFLETINSSYDNNRHPFEELKPLVRVIKTAPAHQRFAMWTGLLREESFAKALDMAAILATRQVVLPVLLALPPERQGRAYLDWESHDKIVANVKTHPDQMRRERIRLMNLIHPMALPPNHQRVVTNFDVRHPRRGHLVTATLYPENRGPEAYQVGILIGKFSGRVGTLAEDWKSRRMSRHAPRHELSEVFKKIVRQGALPDPLMARALGKAAQELELPIWLRPIRPVFKVFRPDKN